MSGHAGVEEMTMTTKTAKQLAKIPKKAKKRERAHEEMGFDEPIPMATQGGYLGVIGILNIYNRLAADMRECYAGTEGQSDR